MTTIADRLLKSIRGKSRGSVFTTKHFLHFGSRPAVDQALSRLQRNGHIRRLGRGLYDYPKVDPRLGKLAPSPDAVAQALASRNSSRIQVTGAQAANSLGLSTQVPARVVYLTDGDSKKVRIGRQTIELRRAAPRRMVTAGRTSGTVIEALRYLGKKRADDRTISILRTTLSKEDKAALKRDTHKAPGWMRPVIEQITEPDLG
jgi:hypothetical protein